MLSKIRMEFEGLSDKRYNELDKELRDDLAKYRRMRRDVLKFEKEIEKCRERIKSCHGVLVLVSKSTYKADGVHWEIKCAKKEGLPVKAIYANKDSKNYDLPNELKSQHVYKWSWPNINKFVDKLK